MATDSVIYPLHRASILPLGRTAISPLASLTKTWSDPLDFALLFFTGEDSEGTYLRATMTSPRCSAVSEGSSIISDCKTNVRQCQLVSYSVAKLRGLDGSLLVLEADTNAEWDHRKFYRPKAAALHLRNRCVRTYHCATLSATTCDSQDPIKML